MNRTRLIFFVTSRQNPLLTADDREVQQLLEAHGWRVEPAIWDNPAVAWADAELLVLRSVWDYHLQVPAFTEWLDRMEQLEVAIRNTPAVLRWNMNKAYLAELHHRAIPVVPTLLLDSRTIQRSPEFATIHQNDLVLKPAVSASAYRTQRLQHLTPQLLHTHLENALQEAPQWLLQPFMPQIANGEWSLVFFEGRYSHAILKIPARDDFRVQEELGGTSTRQIPPPQLLEQAIQIASQLPEHLYLRLDGLATENGFILMEAEMIEPHLFTALAPGSAQFFAEAIMRKLQ